MLTRHMGETVVLEQADGTVTEVTHVHAKVADESDQTVMDVQTRFINQARYKGDQHTLTLIWPKDAPHDLLDAHVTIRGERYRVYGSPWPMAHSPTAYDMRVTAIRSLFLYDIDLVSATKEQDEWGVWHESYATFPVKANLLRLSESSEIAAGKSDLAQTMMFELPPDTWDDAYVAFDYGGVRHSIRSVDRGGECVVIAGTRSAVS